MHPLIDHHTHPLPAELASAKLPTHALEQETQAAETGESVVAPQAGLNAYDARMQAKRERYKELAAKAQAQSQAVHDRACTMSEAIPLGQPILVGHHSEGRDRNFRERIHTTYGKAFALQDKAEHYAQKAASVGAGGISGDDPAALVKLRAEMAGLEHSQNMMKAANKAIRTHNTAQARTDALVDLGFEPVMAAQLVTKDFAGRIGFPSYQLSNNNANMARIRARIAELERLRSRADVEQACEGFTYAEDTAENRVMFVFDGRPDDATRAILKAHAFKWSPTRGAWIRQLTNAGIWNGHEVLKLLTQKK